MGIHQAGGNIVNTTSIAGDPDTMLEAIRTKLTVPLLGAGWTDVSNVKSEISFFAAFLSDGYVATLSGVTYTFYSPPSTGDVLIGGSLQETLENWGAVVKGRQNWDHTVYFNGTAWVIRFYNIPYKGNNLPCSIFPTGTAGIWDFNPDHVTGSGRTWGGGREVKSAKVSAFATALSLKLTTVNRDGYMAITPSDDTVSFDGIDSGKGLWRLLANKYQFFLLCDGSTSSGSMLYAGHLFPARALPSINFITGPHSVGLGGSRIGFLSLGDYYYINFGSPFAGASVGDANKNPIITIPVWGHGTATEKAGNPLAGLPIVNDLSFTLPFDAMLAAPVLAGSDVRNVGWIWNAIVYSPAVTLDSEAATILGKQGHVVLTQGGGDPFQGNAPGSLVIQCSNL